MNYIYLSFVTVVNYSLRHCVSNKRRFSFAIHYSLFPTLKYTHSISTFYSFINFISLIQCTTSCCVYFSNINRKLWFFQSVMHIGSHNNCVWLQNCWRCENTYSARPYIKISYFWIQIVLIKRFLFLLVISWMINRP